MNLRHILITTTIATIIGAGVLIASNLVLILSLPALLNLVNPPPPFLPPCPALPEGETYPPGTCDPNFVGMWPPGALHNVFEFITSFVILYFLSVCIASFISGFSLNGKLLRELCPQTYYWQSLISGFVIGVIGGIVFINTMTNRPHTSLEMIKAGLIFGLPATLTALGGYYLASRRNKTHFIPTETSNR